MTASVGDEGFGSVIPGQPPEGAQVRVVRREPAIFQRAFISLGALGTETIRQAEHNLTAKHTDIENVVSYALGAQVPPINIDRLTSYSLKLGSESLKCTLRNETLGQPDIEVTIDINELLNRPALTAELRGQLEQFSQSFNSLKVEATKIKGFEGRVDLGQVHSNQRSKLDSSFASYNHSVEIMNAFNIDNLTSKNNRNLQDKIFNSITNKNPTVSSPNLDLAQYAASSKRKREHMASSLGLLVSDKKEQLKRLNTAAGSNREAIVQAELLLKELNKLDSFLAIQGREGEVIDLKLAIAKAAQVVAGDGATIPLQDKLQLAKNLAILFLTSKVDRTWWQFVTFQSKTNPSEDKWLEPKGDINSRLQREGEYKAAKELAAEAVGLLFNGEQDRLGQANQHQRVEERYTQFCNKLGIQPLSRDISDLLYKYGDLAPEHQADNFLNELGLTHLRGLGVGDPLKTSLTNCFCKP
jgi:hypothetical protein